MSRKERRCYDGDDGWWSAVRLIPVQCVGCCGSVLPASIPPIQYYCTINKILTNTNIMVASYSIILFIIKLIRL